MGSGSRALIGGAGCRSREGGVGEEVQGGGGHRCHRWASSLGSCPSRARQGMAPGRSSGFRGGGYSHTLPSHLPRCSAPGRPLPCAGSGLAHLSSVRDPGLPAPAAAGWPCLPAGDGGGGGGGESAATGQARGKRAGSRGHPAGWRRWAGERGPGWACRGSVVRSIRMLP